MQHSNNLRTNTDAQLNSAGRKRIVVVLTTYALIFGMMFLAAGTLMWPLAIIYSITTILSFFTIGIWAARKNPGIVNERGKKAENTKPWDKIFSAFYAPMLFLIPAMAGLDFRFGWTSSIAQNISFLSYIGIIPALILPYLAMAENKFLTTTVRLQEERGHYVVSTGPYRFVRHPMYTGAIIAHLLTPIALGSWWAMIPGGIASLALIIRTALEDKTLQEELPGYKAFTQKTKFRLFPGIW
jgi:protein-S-isoprenylcysteine O-methyltransferase Ste14